MLLTNNSTKLPEDLAVIQRRLYATIDQALWDIAKARESEDFVKKLVPIRELRKQTDLEVKEEAGQWVVRAKNWLGQERFKEVSELVKKANGEWVKQGKDSCWVIKK